MDEESDDDSPSELFWYFAAMHVVDVLDVLPPQLSTKLELLPRAPNDREWRDLVRDHLGVPDDFIRSLYTILLVHLESKEAQCFILRGFGCNDPVPRFQEVSDSLNS